MRFDIPAPKTEFVLAMDWRFSTKGIWQNNKLISAAHFNGKYDSSIYGKEWNILIPKGTYLKIEKILLQKINSYRCGVYLSVSKNDTTLLRLVKFIVPLHEFLNIEYYPVAYANQI